MAEWRAINIRKMIPKIKSVVVGATAPINLVSKINKSYHKISISITKPVKNHTHEYSSLSFPFLTR